MFDKLPQDYRDFQAWNWEEIKPYADALVAEEITAGSLTQWMEKWTMLYNLITECYYRLMLRNMTHTNDKKNTNRYHEYGEKVIPEAKKFEKAMIDKLLGSGLEPDNCAIPLRKMRSEASLFREENLSIQTEIEKLLSKRQEIKSKRMVDWDGEELTIKQVLDKLEEPDRAVRERAYRAYIAGVSKDQEVIDQIWVQLLEKRQQLAENAGFADFRAYQWQKLGRFDYDPEDCKEFHQSILECVVPVVTRLSGKRKDMLGVDSLRVWDDHWFIKPDVSGLPPLRPFESIDELNQKMEQVFRQVDPVFGDYYHTMVNEGLLDLDTRKHKTLVGYMEELPASKRPFVITNASNSAGDIDTLLHEGGHSFHMFASAHWPFHYQSSINQCPIEFAEMPSTAMELLAQPFLTSDQGGFYTEKEATRAKIQVLELFLGFLPYMAVVDVFQHWIYENPEKAKDTAKCDQVWADLHQQYLPHLDWSGLEEMLRQLWREQGHIFFDPFYYVEYGVAQLGAVQIWANSQKDYHKAIHQYHTALALGNTASLPELFKAAGAKFAFDKVTISEAIGILEHTLIELEKLR
jgi:oligoendopeptidase F